MLKNVLLCSDNDSIHDVYLVCIVFIYDMFILCIHV